MKHINTKILMAIMSVILATSCTDSFLDRKPLSDNVNEGFFTQPNQLEAYSNAKYDLLPAHMIYDDQNSDNQIAVGSNNNFIPQRRTVPESGGYNLHSALRDCNYFINSVNANFEDGTLTRSNLVNQYVGEMYFFRAYIYFNYLKRYGDFPIVTTTLDPADYEAVVEANKRKPRNEVARFILSDLDAAIELMAIRGSVNYHRLNKETALLFKSRVALHEASWETYHKGTARVPGGAGWAGDTFSGDIETEIAFFLKESMDAAKKVSDAVALYDNYADIFNKNGSGPDDVSEVLLYRMYSADAKTQSLIQGRMHEFVDTGVSGADDGYTHSLVTSFLMENGMPIYDPSSGYQGDATLNKEMTDRDLRLVSSVGKPGDIVWQTQEFTKPALTAPNGKLSTTGYINRKGWNNDNTAPTQPSALSAVIFRSAEAYLNYIEADYMMNQSLDANSQKYWKALRKRAGVSEDYQKTIDATDLTKEKDLAKYSGSTLIDKTLYNIRRERRNEFIGEGFRLNDLYRWRALDMMENYQVQGLNYWEENYKLYPEDFSPSDKSLGNYYMPFSKDVVARNGYTFEKSNYLDPISYDVFRLSTPKKGGDVTTSVVYQNPGWPVEINGTAK